MPQRADEVRDLDFASTEIEEPLPLIVVPDWDEQLRKANHLTRLIDRHLDYEEHGRRLLPKRWRADTAVVTVLSTAGADNGRASAMRLASQLVAVLQGMT